MKIAVILAASILSFASAAAQAAVPKIEESITVHYADLDLDRMPGVVALYLRIKGAAHSLCKPELSERLASRKTYRNCMDNAVTTAVARINRPALSNYTARRLGKPLADSSDRVATR
jgi:UrcA family protein